MPFACVRTQSASVTDDVTEATDTLAMMDDARMDGWCPQCRSSYVRVYLPELSWLPAPRSAKAEVEAEQRVKRAPHWSGSGVDEHSSATELPTRTDDGHRHALGGPHRKRQPELPYRRYRRRSEEDDEDGLLTALPSPRTFSLFCAVADALGWVVVLHVRV
eukprot:GHVU01075104.1.p1 GENE.GHVU01075104.1~~GHVU01075104.1.p1  ORF type:complete len:161 (+),score=15.73 GHVU01075104.1:706-1188(+)